MYHGTRELFGSMDDILRPWMEDLSMDIGLFSWWCSPRLVGKYPPVKCAFSWISLTPIDRYQVYGYLTTPIEHQVR